MVSTVASHATDPGSIPGPSILSFSKPYFFFTLIESFLSEMCRSFSFVVDVLHRQEEKLLHISLKKDSISVKKKKVKERILGPGIEPGSVACEATVLTIIRSKQL
jgi:hypothetical protein